MNAFLEPIDRFRLAFDRPLKFRDLGILAQHAQNLAYSAIQRSINFSTRQRVTRWFTEDNLTGSQFGVSEGSRQRQQRP